MSASTSSSFSTMKSAIRDGLFWWADLTLSRQVDMALTFVISCLWQSNGGGGGGGGSDCDGDVNGGGGGGSGCDGDVNGGGGGGGGDDDDIDDDDDDDDDVLPDPV